MEPETGRRDATVGDDVLCLGCGDNLRGLPVAGRCPECGWAVERSVHGRALRYVDVAWVRGLSHGLAMVYYSIAVLLVTFIACVLLVSVVTTAEKAGGTCTGWLATIVVSVVAFGAANAILLVAYPLGWWLTTRPDPIERPAESRERLILRLSAAMFLPAVYGWTALEWWMNGVVVRAGVHEIWIHVALVLFWLHATTQIRTLERVHRRCLPVSSDARRILRARCHWTLMPLVLLILHWVAWYAGATGAGNFLPLQLLAFGFQGPVLLMWVVLYWVAWRRRSSPSGSASMWSDSSAKPWRPA